MYSNAILSFLMSIILDHFSQNSSLTLSNRLSLKMLLPSFLLMHFLYYDVASFGAYFNNGGGLFYSDACVQALGRFTILSSVRRKQSCTQVSIKKDEDKSNKDQWNFFEPEMSNIVHHFLVCFSIYIIAPSSIF